MFLCKRIFFFRLIINGIKKIYERFFSIRDRFGKKKRNCMWCIIEEYNYRKIYNTGKRVASFCVSLSRLYTKGPWNVLPRWLLLFTSTMFSKKYFLKETRGLKAKERKKEKDAKLLFHNIMAHDLKKLPVRGSYFITKEERCEKGFGARNIWQQEIVVGTVWNYCEIILYRQQLTNFPSNICFSFSTMATILTTNFVS